MGLFKKEWDKPDSSKAEKAIQKINDQNKLFEIACTAKNLFARGYAAERVTDKGLLKKLFDTKDEHILKGLSENSSVDINMHEKIVLLGGYGWSNSLKRIPDQTILARIATEIDAKDRSSAERLSSVFGMITDDKAFFFIAKNRTGSGIFVEQWYVDDAGKFELYPHGTDLIQESVHKLTDPALLQQLVEESASKEAKESAKERLKTIKKK